MADKKTSQETLVDALTVADLLRVTQAGASKGANFGHVKSLIAPSVTDGTTTVAAPSEIEFVGATVTNPETGKALVTIPAILFSETVSLTKEEILDLGATAKRIVAPQGEGVVAVPLWCIARSAGAVGCNGSPHLEVSWGSDDDLPPFAGGPIGAFFQWTTPPGNIDGSVFSGNINTIAQTGYSALSNSFDFIRSITNVGIYLKADSPYTEITDGCSAVAIANGGSGYQLRDIVYWGGVGDEAQGIVSGVGGGGVVTELTLTYSGSGISAGSGVATHDGSGSGLTVDVTVGATDVIGTVTTVFQKVVDP